MDAAKVRRVDPVSIGYLRRPFQEQYAENSSTVAVRMTDQLTSRLTVLVGHHSPSWVIRPLRKEHRLRSFIRCDDKQEQCCPDCGCCCSVKGWLLL